MNTPANGSESNYWINVAAQNIANHYSEDKIVVSSGISPSASYHIGHFREILTADALTWGVNQVAGKSATHIHVVDNFDPLRKRYDFLPEKFEEFVGRPICLIPDPFDCHETYAEHFYKEFEKSAQQMGIFPDQVIRGYEDLYRAGKMTEVIEQVLTNVEAIRQVFEQQSNRKLEADWTPVMVLDEQDHFSNARLSSWDKTTQTIEGIDYTAGRAKLNWRLDWPARWSVLGVMVEPFSHQEHGAAGGSYDTGVAFSKKVFANEPPIPGVQYGNIHLIGDNKKMSSSKGNLITPQQALSIMPPEVLRYFVVKSRPDRTLYFDPGLGIFNLINEFADVEQAVAADQPADFAEAYNFAVAAIADKHMTAAVSTIPMAHLVTSYQSAQGEADTALEILRRTGYLDQVKNQHDIIVRQFEYIRQWLDNYAPENIKFAVLKKLPALELESAVDEFLAKLAERLEQGDFAGQTIHDAVYETAVAQELKPAQAFKALYQLFIGRDSGPKIGYFLSSLDRDFVLARLRREA